MKKIMLIIGILFIIVSPSTCYAEEEQNIFSLEELTIQVMPEFAFHPNDKEKDHPPLLIGYHGTMVNDSDQAQIGQIEIPLPMNEKGFRIGYVADYSADLKQVYEMEYRINRERGTISWTTSQEIGPHERYKFVIEFYTNSLNVNNDKKFLSYRFKSFVDIGLVNVNFTKPSKAKKMKLTPAPKEQSHADGEEKFAYHFQDVKAGDEKSFNLQYERSETKSVMELSKTDGRMEEKTSNNLALGAFGGISLLSAAALTVLIRKRNKVS
ncbi:hypothetical protein ACFPA1_17520 [Neobacillus sp. GCM10023253]|uniref:hypothetical protein n=1 Tax=Neobacillus sp. GCM10023253 TaxID=3252644 RepID=UPI003615DD9E